MKTKQIVEEIPDSNSTKTSHSIFVIQDGLSGPFPLAISDQTVLIGSPNTKKTGLCQCWIREEHLAQVWLCSDLRCYPITSNYWNRVDAPRPPFVFSSTAELFLLHLFILLDFHYHLLSGWKSLSSSTKKCNCPSALKFINGR